MVEVDFRSIESKWQERWEKENTFFTSNDSNKKKFFVLEMFPYPSATGLHMGHALNYIIGDIQARFRRMNGCNVLYPMGYDALGLPAENAAIKAKKHPSDYTNESINNFMIQQKALGLSYDWSKLVKTSDPEYYKWNQYFFLKFLEKGLVYRKKSAVNWCSKCNTVLANEQVHSGKCWRHEDTDVEIKHLEQWFIKTTNYAEELNEMIEGLDWPARIKAMQTNWIGKSFGTEINFTINEKVWPIFTTRPDTIFGVTFLVISAQHSKLFEIVTPEQKSSVEEFLKKLRSVSEKEMDAMDKEGVFTGAYAINPINGEKVPVYAGNFVVADYGSGMVMAVPTHDQRDFEFAKKYNIPLRVVICPEGKKLVAEEMTCAYTGEGVLVNSNEFSGQKNVEAMKKITEYLEKKGVGKKTINFKLRDWLVSRQRYWGTPIPIIYCEKCGIVPVPEKDLPIKLPYEVTFGEGNPLLSNKEFVNCKCPKCGTSARRETDTMDTFFDSSWYYLRYMDATNSEVPFVKETVKKWLPVDQYIGGAEHACMHLIYARFFTKALRDLGYLDFDEPFTKLFNQGMLHGADGNKMSKSLGNVINPLDVIEKYSTDSLRFNTVSLSAPNSDSVWSDNGMESSHKFLQKVYSVLSEIKIGSSTKIIESKINKTIKEYSFDIDNFKYNLGVIKLRSLIDAISQEQEISKNDLESVLKLFSPICPHFTEEIFHTRIKNSMISLEEWPKCDESKIDLHLEKIEEVISSLRVDIIKIKELAKIEKVKKVKIIVAPQWKWEAISVIRDACKEKPDFSVAMKALMSKEEYKKHGGEIQNFIKTTLSRLSDFSEIKPFNEVELFNEAKTVLESEFGSIEVVKAEDCNEPKAKNAFPTKPALIIE
ncbi:MAG: leucine--tRNA ligase [Candidatus Diapherotrites archaeon]|uniref:Leucine--tRNA ligase n=1 Tax=Candidatus Iainarchaeum sp. TaxID=3101447 RepID=A0A7K4BZT1_9ARCH|nr:leucine--tRNA ligase [Candidatus Diapherotrites archaeon]